jgi:hypothetical protein
MMKSALRLLGSLAASAALGLALLGAGAWLYFALNGPEPQPWHQARLTEEFTAADAGRVTSIAAYRRLEDRLFDQLRRDVYAKVVPGNLAPFNRFAVGSRSDPGVWPVNWNRTFEIEPEHPVGGVLLLHGLTDCPIACAPSAKTWGRAGSTSWVCACPATARRRRAC